MPAATPSAASLPVSWRQLAFRSPGAVLLESSAPDAENSKSYLFTHPIKLLRATTPAEIQPLFHQIERALAAGKYVAGWFAYECGFLFQDLALTTSETPLALLGIFEQPAIFDHTSDTSEAPPRLQDKLSIAPMLHVTPERYAAAILRIQEWIAAGDTYQVNYTVPASSSFDGAPALLYEALRQTQPSPYSAVIRLQPGETILSLSPELFFRAEPSGQITTRPMKGTAARGPTQVEDDRNAVALQADEKSRAEHVMIVDLLRNDLGRICSTGSVHVPELFHVERYPTLLQMTSTVRGLLRPQTPWYEIFEALFPCGSVTGAPKHHTMKLIEQVESRTRGVYTGSIGFFAPDRSATFNVAIRTLSLRNGVAHMGVGGGIVADSTAQEEYRECLLKLGFLQRAGEPVSVFETVRWSEGRFPLLHLHLSRMNRSAEALGFAFNAADAEVYLRRLASGWTGEPKRVRLSLAQDGSLGASVSPLEPWPPSLRIRVSEKIMRSTDPALSHKTTFRAVYNHELLRARADHMDEAIFQNERGELTEGCISSLILTLDGGHFTPPLACGVLPGVFRRHLLEAGSVSERVLTMQHLLEADAVHLCNALRGLAPVHSIQVGEALYPLRQASSIAPLW